MSKSDPVARQAPSTATDACPCGHDLSGFYMCLNGRIYGPCTDENCGGVCDDTYGRCTSDDCACEETT